MSHNKDTLCWRCKGNSGPSKAFAFWNIQQNERPHHENGLKVNNNGQDNVENQDNSENCNCTAQSQQDEMLEEIVHEVNTDACVTESDQNDITGMTSLVGLMIIV